MKVHVEKLFNVALLDLYNDILFTCWRIYTQERSANKVKQWRVHKI